MDLFRKEAVESSLLQSEKSVAAHAVGVRYTLFTAALVLCAAIFTIWLIFGEIYETVSVNGIIWPAEGGGSVCAEYGGTVSKVTVSRGSRVEAGDILAVIPQEDILRQIDERAAESGPGDLYDEYDRRSVIRASADGIVTYIAGENSYVSSGDKIAEITPYDENGNNMTLTAFISADKGGLISLGAEAQVMPDSAPREKYGYINAYVSGISQYPVKGEYIKENMSDTYLPSLDEEDNYLQLEITLLADAGAPSRLKWSNPAG